MKRLTSPARRFTSMAEWPCFEPVAGSRRTAKGCFRRPIEAYSQGLGSMITEPRTDGQRTPLQDFETLYIGGGEAAVSRRATVGRDGAKSRLCAIAKESLTTRMARIVLGTGPYGTSTRLNDE